MQISVRKCKKCGVDKPFPDGFWKHDKGYRHECKDCMRSRMRTWEHAHPEKKREKSRTDYHRVRNDPQLWERRLAQSRVNSGGWIDKVKQEVYAAYGGAICACCGETEWLFLTIDHVNNDGHVHQKNERVTNLYTHLRARNFPPGFQVLCMQCNFGKARNGGICPHKSRQEGSETIAQASTLK